MWCGDGRGGVFNPFSVLCHSTLLPRQSLEYCITRTSFSLEYSPYTSCRVCLPEKRELCQLLFFSQLNARPTERGRWTGLVGTCPSRFGLALGCPVSSLLSPLHIRSTQPGPLVAILDPNGNGWYAISRLAHTPDSYTLLFILRKWMVPGNCRCDTAWWLFESHGKHTCMLCTYIYI